MIVIFLLITGYIKNRVAHNGIGNQAIILSLTLYIHVYYMYII